MNGCKNLSGRRAVGGPKICVPNKVEEEENAVNVFMREFTGVTPYTVEVAAITSFMLSK
ncbi:MAG: hypothetical protein QW432_00585 [Desulfurococcaceae archaeon]